MLVSLHYFFVGAHALSTRSLISKPSFIEQVQEKISSLVQAPNQAKQPTKEECSFCEADGNSLPSGLCDLCDISYNEFPEEFRAAVEELNYQRDQLNGANGSEPEIRLKPLRAENPDSLEVSELTRQPSVEELQELFASCDFCASDVPQEKLHTTGFCEVCYEKFWLLRGFWRLYPKVPRQHFWFQNNVF